MWSSFFLLIAYLALQSMAVWPAPKSFKSGNIVLWIEPDVKFTYNGGSSPSGGISSKSLVEDAFSRATATLFTQNLVPWKLIPRHGLQDFEPKTDKKVFIDSVTITQTGTDKTFTPLAGEVDESYNLTISEDGKAEIIGVSSHGILHGLQTFIQLFYRHSTGAGTYTKLAPVTIVDCPKFPHRALNLDVSRNWYPVQDILRTIDALAWNKFNRIHIHMTDSQSWPIEIPALPELAQKGSYAKGLTYSPNDISTVQKWALQRGIQVIFEFDMPGHTTSVGLAYPNLIAAANAHPWNDYCAEPPCGSLQLNNPDVSKFLEKLFNDLLPRVKPYSSYFHTGGDEVNKNTYLLDPTVKSNDPAVLKPLIQKFLDRNHDQIRKVGLTPIVWEEMLLEWDLTLGKDVVVQSWLSDESVAKIISKGHKTIAGNYNYWYLDCGKGQWLNFDNGRSFTNFYPFNDYCSPYKNWRLVYSYDPLAGVAPENAHLVLGGEVHIWSEQTDSVNLDDMVWPRACAAGEVLWSGRQDAEGKNRSQIDAGPRLAEMRERMVLRGVRAGPVQMVFCTQANATECAL